MKKIFLTSVLAMCMVCPAMADIAKNANSATCDSNTIGTTTGPANLQADWTANTIHLDWYSNDTKQTSTTCTYDGGITLPSTPTVPTGYTFGGWKVRAAAPQQTGFDLNTVFGGIGICTQPTSAGIQNDSTNTYGPVTLNTDTYGITGDQQWAAEFSSGTVRGVALCSSTPGTEMTIGTPAETSSGQYCWCKATGFDAEKDKTYLNVGSSSWVFLTDKNNTDYCGRSCVEDCVVTLFSNIDFRGAVFGVDTTGVNCNN